MTSKERAERTKIDLKERARKKKAVVSDYIGESRSRQEKFKFRKGRR